MNSLRKLKGRFPLNIVSIGEVLWDVFNNSEYIGGAPFNFSVHATKLGHNVLFVSIVGNDTRGKKILKRAAEFGLSTKYIKQINEHTTTYVEIETTNTGQTFFTLNPPRASDLPLLDSKLINEIINYNPDLIYFGTFQQTSRRFHELTQTIIESNPGAKYLYDINLRPNYYTAELVIKLLSYTSILKINEEEVWIVNKMFDLQSKDLKEFGYCVNGRFDVEIVCITRGKDGCAVYLNGNYLETNGYTVKVVDTIGSGDAFIAGFLHGMSKGWDSIKICEFANRLGALIASKKGATPEWSIDEVYAL